MHRVRLCSPGQGAWMAPMDTPVMTRPQVRLLGGVCAGFADHTGLPLALVRTATVVLAVCGGAGLLLYGWLWATTPTRTDAVEPVKRSLTRPAEQPDAPDAPHDRRSAPVTEILLGLALLA